jgi:hypothetical protein
VLTFKLVANKKTVGTAKLTLAAGRSKTVTVKLNAAGKKALKKARKLSVQLVVAQTTNGKQRTLVTKKLTLRK